MMKLKHKIDPNASSATAKQAMNFQGRGGAGAPPAGRGACPGFGISS